MTTWGEFLLHKKNVNIHQNKSLVCLNFHGASISVRRVFPVTRTYQAASADKLQGNQLHCRASYKL